MRPAIDLFALALRRFQAVRIHVEQPRRSRDVARRRRGDGNDREQHERDGLGRFWKLGHSSLPANLLRDETTVGRFSSIFRVRGRYASNPSYATGINAPAKCPAAPARAA